MSDRGALMARAELCLLVATGFAYPDAALRTALVDGSFGQALTEACERFDSDALRQGCAAVLDAVAAVVDNPRRLEEEHTFLFSRNVPTPPNESSYDQDRTFSRVRELSDVASYYAAFGFRVSDLARETADHVSVELEFLAALYAKETYAAENDRPDQAEICAEARHKFLTDHLGRWFPAFRERLHDNGRLAFYPALADLVHTCLSAEPAFSTVTVQG